MAPYNVYAIYSAFDKRIYVGMSKDVLKRVAEHNQGRVFSTKGYRPWQLFFQELAPNRKAARIREKYWKSGIGKERLKLIIPR